MGRRHGGWGGIALTPLVRAGLRGNGGGGNDLVTARRLGAVSPGLRSQMLRASVSVSLNLCEACGYHTASRAVALIEIAIGSCNERERVLRLCGRRGVRDDRLEQIIANVGTVRAMTYGFRKRLQNHPPPTPTPGRNAHPRPQPSRPEPESPL